MTPALLRELLQHHAPEVDWPHELPALLGVLEGLAEERPTDLRLRMWVLAAHDLADADPTLPEGFKAEGLVRADRLSTTWAARDSDGARVLVRVPRRSTTATQRRILARDFEALEGLVDGIELHTHTLIAPLPGGRLDESDILHTDAVRVLGDAVRIGMAWAARGIGCGLPDPAEARVVEGRLVLVCLTPHPADHGLLHQIVRALPAMPEGPIAQFIRGVRQLTVRPEEAVELFQSALREQLQQEAVELRRREISSRQQDRRARLYDAVARLSKTLSPPLGEGGVGFDLEGHPTRVASNGASVEWGSGAMEPLFAEGAFDAPCARRFLRACATAPTGGDAYTESMGRWVSAGLKLRTVRMLLERT